MMVRQWYRLSIEVDAPPLVQSQVGWGAQQPDVVKNICVHGIFKDPFQPIPFYDSMKTTYI